MHFSTRCREKNCHRCELDGVGLAVNFDLPDSERFKSANLVNCECDCHADV